MNNGISWEELEIDKWYQFTWKNIKYIGKCDNRSCMPGGEYIETINGKTVFSQNKDEVSNIFPISLKD